MSYTLTTATTQVRYLLNETTAAFWTDVQIQDWIKQGVIDVSSKLLCVTASGTITLATSQDIYTSADESWIATCLKPKIVYYSDANTKKFSMQMINDKQFGHYDGVDQGPKYYHYDSTLRTFYIFPQPTAATNGDDVSVIYSYVTDDVTLLKDEYQPLVFLFACYKAKLKERLYQEALMYFQLYKDSVLFERTDKYDLGSNKLEEFKVN